MELTKSELELMNVIWKAKKPLSRNDILALSGKKTWKDSSIHILLNGLLKKGAIKEDGMVKCGKTYARLFSPQISCEAYYAEAVFSPSAADNLPMLFFALINAKDVTPELLDELEAMLEKRKEQLK